MYAQIRSSTPGSGSRQDSLLANPRRDEPKGENHNGKTALKKESEPPGLQPAQIRTWARENGGEKGQQGIISGTKSARFEQFWLTDPPLQGGIEKGGSLRTNRERTKWG